MPQPESMDRPKEEGASPALEERALSKWISWATHGVLLLGISTVAAFVVSPTLYGQQIPDIGPDEIGKPFHSNLPSGFKAGRDYEIINEAVTEQRRQEARSSVRPVYDFNPAVLSDLKQTVHDAFAAMQEIVAQLETEPSASKTSAAEERPSPGSGRKSKKSETPKAGGEELLPSRVRLERRNFEQKLLQVEDDDFIAIASANFSREVELAVIALLEHAYTSPIAGSRDELAQMGGQGITVRVLGSRSEHVSSVGPPVVNDASEAKAELERFAAVPGSMLPQAPPLRRAIVHLAKRQIRPNLTINIAETEARRVQAADAVKEVVIQIKKGQRVIADGELINETHRVILRAMRAQADQIDRFEIQVGGTGLVALVIACAYAFHRAAFRRFRPTRKDALLLGTLLIGMLIVIRVWVTVADAVHDKYARIPASALYYLVPLAGGAMLVRFILSEELALFFAIVLASIAGVMLGNSLTFGVYSLMVSLVAAERISRARDRGSIFKAGAISGAVGFVLVLFFALAEGKGLTGESFLTACCSVVGNSLAAPMMVVALTPLIEMSFGYASDIKLLELANLNHPALKELIVQAPGTYHHSIIVGSLVEGAAEAIGANPLLARSCAYYHDIGKGRNPLYFGENQKGENRHDALAPAMSAVIIKRHVTDGMEMARQYKLPKLVADAIPQHHGTRLVGYFYQKAIKEQEGKENLATPDDAVYRYPGVKPQFREAALVMIADAVEAASRAMPEPTSAKLQALVQKLINVIFSEGQLEECDLTLKDLNLIAQSFVRTLEGIYHARPAYPPAAVGGPRTTPLPADLTKAIGLTVAGKGEGKRNTGG